MITKLRVIENKRNTQEFILVQSNPDLRLVIPSSDLELKPYNSLTSLITLTKDHNLKELKKKDLIHLKYVDL